MKELDELPKENLLSNIPDLQYKIKKQPEQYVNEVIAAVDQFKLEFEKVKQSPANKHEKFIELSLLLAHIAEYYKDDLDFVHLYIIDLLEKYAEMLNPHLRLKLVICLILLRSKNLIAPIKSITLFMKLFQIKHKELRKIMISHIINDIKRINVHHKNQVINKQIQNLIFEIVKNNADNSAKRALHIMIQLYKKNIWNDAKTVNIIAMGCMNPYYKVKMISCGFLIETTENLDEDSDEEEDGPVQVTEKKGSKQTKAKVHRLERDKKRAQKRQRKRENAHRHNHFFPIDLINDPQDFVEKIFAILKKTTERFELKIALMSVIARMIGRHQLLLLNFYSFLQKYCFPHQREIGKILAFLAESCHQIVPTEEFHPIIKHIIDNFISDRCTEDKICMGLNVIREMCIKNPAILDEFNLNYLAEYKDYKNKNVASAAKSIVNYFREVNPLLLNKKFRGRNNQNAEISKPLDNKSANVIKGADLLGKTSEGIPVYCDQILDDSDFRRIKQLQRKKIEEELQKRNEEEEEEENEEINSDSNNDDDEEDDEDIEELDDEEIEEEDFDEEELDEEIDEEEEENLEKPNKKNKNKSNNEIEIESDDDLIESSEDENPHGFVSENKITFFKKRGKEGKLERKEQLKNTVKEKKYNGPKKKKRGHNK